MSFAFLQSLFASRLIYTFILLLNLTVPLPTIGNSLYVDQTFGSDAYHGFTTSSAVKTIQRAIDIASPGTTIYIRKGIYNESLVINHSGTENKRITLASFSNEPVTINGGHSFAIRSKNEASYWTLEGLTLKSRNRYTLRLGWWGGAGTNNWIVRNNQLYGANFLIGSYHIWENNDISGVGYNHDFGDAAITSGGDSHHNVYRENTIHDFTHLNARGIWSQGHTHDSIIQSNTIYNIFPTNGLGQGIDLDGAGAVEWRHIVDGNIIYNVSYVGIQLENVFDTRIENNLISQGDAGIIIINYNESIGCDVGGEHQQYGDINNDRNCRGGITNNIIQNNTITTSGAWRPGYGGIMVWYAGGINILNNHIIANEGRHNAAINIQGEDHEIPGISILNNIIRQGTGSAICLRNPYSLKEDDSNQFYWTDETKIYAVGPDCNLHYTLDFYQERTEKAQNSHIITPEFSSLQLWFYCPATTNHLVIFQPEYIK